MNWFEKAVAGSYTIWHEDGLPPYGWFHWIWILATVLSSVFCSWFFRKPDRKLRILLIFYAIVMLLLEVWKQMGESYEYKRSVDRYVWEYDWQYFPLQFCSTPMYIALAAGIVFKGKIQNALFTYLGTYGLFGGFITYAVPKEILGYRAYFSLFHTMFFHGFMIVLCTTLLVSHVDPKFKNVVPACAIFLFFVCLAEIINCIFHAVKPGDYFSLMHISPFFKTRLPVFGKLQDVHFSLFIISYILLFIFVAFLVLCLRKSIGWLVGKISLKVKAQRAKRKGDVELAERGKFEEGNIRLVGSTKKSGGVKEGFDEETGDEEGNWPSILETEIEDDEDEERGRDEE